MKYTLENIIERFQRKEKLEFLFFWGHTVREEVTKACFSQWFPFQFSENGTEYKTAEHYMMAGKAKLFNDHETLEEILNQKLPISQKV